MRLSNLLLGYDEHGTLDKDHSYHVHDVLGVETK